MPPAFQGHEAPTLIKAGALHFLTFRMRFDWPESANEVRFFLYFVALL